MSIARVPVVAIVGRPNVGKSTLFNQLVRRRRSLVLDQPGVTRDRLYARVESDGLRFDLIDTGGYDLQAADPLIQETVEQTRLAIQEADLVLFVLDAIEGLVPLDQEIAGLLRRGGKKVLHVVNKIDVPGHIERTYEFHQLGAPEIHALSAEHRRGLEELLDAIGEALPEARAAAEASPGAAEDSFEALEWPLETEEWPSEAADVAEGDGDEPLEDEEVKDEEIQVAIIGRPNAGKSTLLNQLCGYERSVADPRPGTTRDAVDTLVTHEGRAYRIVDTAGIRKKARTKLSVDKLSVLMALKALERSHVALLVIDAVEGPTDQDAHIAGYAVERGRALAIVVNKWDLVEKDGSTAGAYAKVLRDRLAFVGYAPILFISAKTGQRVAKLFEMIDKLRAEHARKIGTGELNRFFAEMLGRNPPPMSRGKRPKIYYITQTGKAPPTFTAFTNTQEKWHFSYERYLLNGLRERFGFEGTPIRLRFRYARKEGGGRARRGAGT